MSREKSNEIVMYLSVLSLCPDLDDGNYTVVRSISSAHLYRCYHPLNDSPNNSSYMPSSHRIKVLNDIVPVIASAASFETVGEP